MKRILLIGAFVFVSGLVLLGQTTSERRGLDVTITNNAIFYFQLIPQNTDGGGAIDALFTLSEGPISAYDDCSTILRFNTGAGANIDVHDGGYTKTNNVAIVLEQAYHCWVEINFANETYSTYVKTGSLTSPTLIHADADFRKNDVSGLFYWSAIYTGGSNTLSVEHTGLVSSVGDIPAELIIESAYGDLENDNLRISNISPVSISDFVDGLEYPKTATVQVLDATNTPITLPSTQPLASNMTLRVVGTQTTDYELDVRAASSENKVIWAFDAQISHADLIIADVYNNMTVSQFQSGLIISDFASADIWNTDQNALEGDLGASLSSSHRVRVISESADTVLYQIVLGSNSLESTTITDSVGTFDQIRYQNLVLDGHIEWRIKNGTSPIGGSLIDIVSDDVWIYFDNIRPQKFADEYLGQFLINGQTPEPIEVDGTGNIRIAQNGYAGCILISHSDSFKPLAVYADANQGGESKELGLYTYYKTAELGTLADNIESFVLKKGYMASFSENTNGTGNSKVIIADKEDLTFNSMPTGLSNNVSFVRVFPWRWAAKKSFADGSYEKNEILNSTWRYNWDNGSQSTLDIEYVPMRHNPGWPAYSNIDTKKNVTHSLFYNEPDNSVDDGFSTVEDAIAAYPNMLASGLRVGTPAPTDGGVGWLYDFYDQCQANNYRIDFVAIHFYRCGNTASGLYNFLKAIHDYTGLPIWVTELNNGANWTTCDDPTYEEQAQTIDSWVDMLESTPFIERYALYGRVEAVRQMFYDGTTSLTPAGVVYRDKASGMAYESSATAHVNNPYPYNNAEEIELETALYWNPNPETTLQVLYFGETYPPKLEAHLDGKVNKYPVTLEYDKTYYWRVDEFTGTMVKGEELKFNSIAFRKASDPVPADGEVEVYVYDSMSWKSDPYKPEIHMLYLGEDSTSLQLKSSFLDGVTVFAPKDLEGEKTYYWRVDEHLSWRGQDKILEGDIWSFSTALLLGLNDQQKDLVVYPVPLRNTLIIQGLEEERMVNVLNISGQKIMAKKTLGKLDVGSLPRGIYIIEIEGFKPLKVVK